VLVVVEDLEGVGHETEDEDEKSKESAEFAAGVERLEVVKRSSAKKLESEEKSCPDIPAGPVKRKAENEQEGGQE
jgi:hypothetical protein